MDLEIIAPAQYIKGAATAHYNTCAARAHNSISTATAGLQHISVYTSLENQSLLGFGLPKGSPNKEVFYCFCLY